jgi:hypothetical protein
MKDHKKTDTNDLDETRTPAEEHGRTTPNPPRTTTGKWTAPKFGSAGSGGAELEPGPEKS